MSNLHTSINSSTSKQLYSFSKSERFPQRRALNNRVAYEAVSTFDQAPQGGSGRPFYQTSTRFDYYSGSGKKKGNLPSPLHYKIPDTFGKESLKPNEQFSFGVGRDNMKKMFIDNIKKDGDISRPGPGKYSHEKRFGSMGVTYSMAQKLNHDDLILAKSKKLPGPGYYQAPDVVGQDLAQS